MFDLAFAIEILPQLLQAVILSLLIVVCSFLAALLLGFPLLLCRLSRLAAVARPASLFVEFVRSTPLLVQIYFFFFVLPSAGIRLSPVITGIIALSMHYSCYMSEIYRSGIQSIPFGQWDATIALGFSRQDTYRFVVLPQMVPTLIPLAGNLLVFMIKDTPLLASIGVADIMFVAQGISQDHYQFLEPITMCGLIFMVLSAITGGLVRATARVFGREWLGRTGLHG